MKELFPELKNKKIIITGGKGFLGRYLTYELKNICSDVYLYEKDIRHIETLKSRFDIVYHLAALNKIDSSHTAELLFDINVNGTLSVMHYCYEKGARCIFASSSAVYKPTRDGSLLNEDSRLEPISLYGISKMLAENICRYHAENFATPVISLRIFNMYGPGQKAPFLIPYAMGQLSRLEPVTLRTPEVVRDFVYVTDVARAFILSSPCEHNGFFALNIGTGRGLNIKNVVEKLARKMKSNLLINTVIEDYSGIDWVIADTRKASKVLGWNSKISIDEGLESVVGQDRLPKEKCKL